MRTIPREAKAFTGQALPSARVLVVLGRGRRNGILALGGNQQDRTLKTGKHREKQVLQNIGVRVPGTTGQRVPVGCCPQEHDDDDDSTLATQGRPAAHRTAQQPRQPEV